MPLSAPPGAFCAAADIAIATLSSKQPNKIRNTARLLSPWIRRVALGPWRNAGGRSHTAGCCALTPGGQATAASRRLMKSWRFIRSPRRGSDARVRKGRRPNHSGVPLTFLHETVLGGAGEFLALRAPRLWRACFPFTFFQEAVESSARQRLAILADRFACAGFLRHGRADRQGRNDGSEDNPPHGTSSRWSTRRL